MSKKSYTYLIGIDEVGRGPIAGPVAVGALAFLPTVNKKVFKGVKDSKKLSAEAREKWLTIIKKEEKAGNILSAVTFVSSTIIDTKGLSFAIKYALKKSLETLALPCETCKVLLDGGLKAPVHYKNQLTIIKGDEKEKVISLASIVAKVARDKKLVQFAKQYPHYGFEKHKGYGTREHYKALKKQGLSKIHRKSFLKSLVKKASK